MTSAFDDQRRTPSWLFMGTNDGLRKRRSGSPDSMQSVSDDECPPDTSTPSGLSKGPFLKSLLPNPMISPKKQQINDSLCDSGFQDASMTFDCTEALDEARNEARDDARNDARNEVPENEVPKQSSVLSCVLPLAAILVIFAALGFGLVMMMNKEAVEVDHHQLNGKYKSMQFARERIQTSVNMEGDDALDSNMVDPDDFDNSNADDVNPDANQDGEIDYPDDPQFRSSFI